MIVVVPAMFAIGYALQRYLLNRVSVQAMEEKGMSSNFGLMSPILVTFGMSIVIIIEGALAFLGVGFPPPTPTWGKMVGDGFEEISKAPHITFVPAGVMFLTILSLNMIGDRLRALSDVKASAV